MSFLCFVSAVDWSLSLAWTQQTWQHLSSLESTSGARLYSLIGGVFVSPTTGVKPADPAPGGGRFFFSKQSKKQQEGNSELQRETLEEPHCQISEFASTGRQPRGNHTACRGADV